MHHRKNTQKMRHLKREKRKRKRKIEKSKSEGNKKISIDVCS
jgi:hypothetical protein